MKKFLSFTLLAMFIVGCDSPSVYYPSGGGGSNNSYVVTGDTMDLTHKSVILSGKVKVDVADYETIDWGMMYSTDKAELESHLGTKVLADGALEEDVYSVSVTGLEAETQYYYCAFVFLNEKQYKYGSIKSFTTLEAPKIDGIGVFYVSENKQVTFSKGNLQYTRSTDTWSFAENQWDYIGTDNVTGGSVESDPTYGDEKSGDALADKIDLFGWSTSNTTAPFGVSTSENNSDYSGSFVDWGTNQIGAEAPNTWRTLTYNEWYYVVFNRPNATSLRGVAQVNGVNGLILLPDTWTCPSGVTFMSGFHGVFGVDYYAAYQTFSADQWSKLESAGAVFLPASGRRHGSLVDVVQLYGIYWSATENDSYGADCLYFNSESAYMSYYDRYYGRIVRLVKDL